MSEWFEFMTTPPPTSLDEHNETLYWLRIAKRILAGDIAPGQARAALESSRVRESVNGTDRAMSAGY